VGIEATAAQAEASFKRESVVSTRVQSEWRKLTRKRDGPAPHRYEMHVH